MAVGGGSGQQRHMYAENSGRADSGNVYVSRRPRRANSSRFNRRWSPSIVPASRNGAGALKTEKLSGDSMREE